jgi:hypothetical protein
MEIERDISLNNMMKMRDRSLLEGIVLDYSFDNRFIIDSHQQRQATFNSIGSPTPSETFPHGPPSPSGSKFSLILTEDSYLTIPRVTDRNIMTIRFSLFLTSTTRDHHWKTLFYTRDTTSEAVHLRVRIWPTVNRLQVVVGTETGEETIDTISRLLVRRWYNIAITIINDQNRVNIYINGYLDGNSMVLKGNRETTNEVSDYIFGRSADLPGVNAYLDNVQIFERELEPVEIMPANAFIQSLSTPFIMHGCQS